MTTTQWAQTFDIGSRKVGVGQAPFVIADIGSNHDGSLARAKEMIALAAECGADAVKFQSFRASTLASGVEKRLVDAFAAAELPLDWLPHLSAAAEAAGVTFLSTPFDSDAVGALSALGMPVYKVASGDLTNHLLLDEVAALGLPVILSTGAAYLSDIRASLAFLSAKGLREVVVLHCVSAYPTAFADLNVRAMQTIAEAFGVPVGLSDHTPGATGAVVAAALGACVVEKHITKDRSLAGPDHGYALEPAEFADLCSNLAIAHEVLGDGQKGPGPDETERYWAWRGLYAARNLSAGHVVRHEDLVALRPRVGIGADEVGAVVGRVLDVGLSAGQAVRASDLRA